MKGNGVLLAQIGHINNIASNRPCLRLLVEMDTIYSENIRDSRLPTVIARKGCSRKVEKKLFFEFELTFRRILMNWVA